MYEGAGFWMKRKRDLFVEFRNRYDENGEFIWTDEAKERRAKKLAVVRAKWTWTRERRIKMSATQRSHMRKTFRPFYLKDPNGTIFYTNVLMDFIREMGLHMGSFRGFANKAKGMLRYKGWSHPTEEEISSARSTNTLVEKVYRTTAISPAIPFPPDLAKAA
jgi:hypothetical protein